MGFEYAQMHRTAFLVEESTHRKEWRLEGMARVREVQLDGR